LNFNFDIITLILIITFGVFVGFILTVVFLTFPIRDDFKLIIELVDCKTILEYSFDFKMPFAENYYRDECI